MRKPHLLLATAITLATGSVAGAQMTRGRNIVQPAGAEKPRDLGQGRSYLALADHQICTTDPATSPLNGASGDCSGACLIGPGEKSTCMGSCLWVDKTGDLAFFTWDGQTAGTWKLAGGTGKYDGASGKGTWKNAGSTAGGFSLNDWEGTIELKK